MFYSRVLYTRIHLLIMIRQITRTKHKHSLYAYPPEYNTELPHPLTATTRNTELHAPPQHRTITSGPHRPHTAVRPLVRPEDRCESPAQRNHHPSRLTTHERHERRDSRLTGVTGVTPAAIWRHRSWRIRDVICAETETRGAVWRNTAGAVFTLTLAGRWVRDDGLQAFAGNKCLAEFDVIC